MRVAIQSLDSAEREHLREILPEPEANAEELELKFQQLEEAEKDPKLKKILTKIKENAWWLKIAWDTLGPGPEGG